MNFGPTSLGTVSIHGLRIYAHHGVARQETIVGNTFEVDVDIIYPCSTGMLTDGVGNIINYAEVIDVVKEVMAIPSRLLENVVFRIYRAISSRWPMAEGGKVTVKKLQPPIAAELASVSFTYAW
ncbi:MAG: dihydroneopterin aldolase [Muribaculaceae bacterium]|nr:dihydroneopterin aldolase [Muribaculaceae bacterium]